MRKPILFIVITLFSICLLLMSGGLGYVAGLANSKSTETDGKMAPFWQAWDIIHSEYVDQPVDDIKLVQGAIDGLVSSLGDEHSGYMDQASFDAANATISGYEGIGAELDTTGDLIRIVSTFPGSPAAEAGLKPGDQIVKINGIDVTGEEPSAIWQRVKGPAGTHVLLGILREGEETLRIFDIVRAAIQVPSVHSSMEAGDIAYLAIYFFGDNTDEQVAAELTKLMAQKPKGLVLDLRQNPGGLVDSAIQIASQFLPADTVVFLEKRSDGKFTPEYTKPGGLALDIPLVVLVDEGSASASEIVAGAIQDHRRGRLVGQTTFGKGSEQYWIQLMDKQGAIRITIARWYTPLEQQISGTGLTPDVVVSYTEEDFNAGKDPQKEKALELLAQEGG
jgi:carboxyl-terminal processing protease